MNLCLNWIIVIGMNLCLCWLLFIDQSCFVFFWLYLELRVIQRQIKVGALMTWWWNFKIKILTFMEINFLITCRKKFILIVFRNIYRIQPLSNRKSCWPDILGFCAWFNIYWIQRELLQIWFLLFVYVSNFGWIEVTIWRLFLHWIHIWLDIYWIQRKMLQTWLWLFADVSNFWWIEATRLWLLLNWTCIWLYIYWIQRKLLQMCIAWLAYVSNFRWIKFTQQWMIRLIIRNDLNFFFNRNLLLLLIILRILALIVDIEIVALFWQWLLTCFFFVVFNFNEEWLSLIQVQLFIGLFFLTSKLSSFFVVLFFSLISAWWYVKTSKSARHWEWFFLFARRINNSLSSYLWCYFKAVVNSSELFIFWWNLFFQRRFYFKATENSVHFCAFLFHQWFISLWFNTLPRNFIKRSWMNQACLMEFALVINWQIQITMLARFGLVGVHRKWSKNHRQWTLVFLDCERIQVFQASWCFHLRNFIAAILFKIKLRVTVYTQFCFWSLPRFDWWIWFRLEIESAKNLSHSDRITFLKTHQIRNLKIAFFTFILTSWRNNNFFFVEIGKPLLFLIGKNSSVWSQLIFCLQSFFMFFLALYGD